MPTRVAFAEATRIIHHETNPLHAATTGAVASQPGGGGQSAAVADQPGGDGSHLRSALHAAAASELSRTDSRLRDDQELGDHHARLFWRLHVLLHYRSPGPRDSVAQPGVDSGRTARDGGRPAVQRARSATSVGRPRTCTRCSARVPKSRRSAGDSRVCIPRSANCWEPITDR